MKQKQTKTKKPQSRKLSIKSQLGFFKLDVGSKKSLAFFKDLILCLDFKITYEDDHQFKVTNDDIDFAVYHGFNVSGSGIYILHTGVNTFFFKVKSKKDVDKFREKFLKPRKIKSRPVVDIWKHEEEGKYSVFFDTTEHITIGVVSE